MDPLAKLKSKFTPPSRRTLGVKRASAAAYDDVAGPSRDTDRGSPASAKKTRIVLPTQSIDDQDGHEISDEVESSTPLPPQHAYLLSRNQPPSDSSTTSPSTTVSPSRHGPFYLCTWRKPQHKKHKTWDGDAILVVKDLGAKCTLICSETGKELVNSAKFPYGQLASGDALALGGKEVEVDREISAAEYRELVATTRGELSPAKNDPPIVAVRTRQTPFMAPAQRSAIVPVDINKLTPARVESFYGKPAARPVAENSAPKRKGEPSPVKPSGLVNAGQGKIPHPRFDPDAPGAIVMMRPDTTHQQQHNSRHQRPIVDVVLDPQLTKALRPHQVEGVKFLYERVMGMHAAGERGQGCILADEMGLGKTLQTIALVLTLMKQCCYYSPRSCTIERAMIVCPLTLVKNWKREFRKWIGGNALNVLCIDEGKGRKEVQQFVSSKAYHVLVIGYEKLRTCIDIVKDAQPPVDLIVCDEGHRLKSKDAKTTLMFEELHAKRKVILSGTPIQNNLSEFYQMISFVAPGLLGPAKQYQAMFEDPIVRSRAQYCSKQVRALGQARAQALAAITKDIILRRTADILIGYLPPKREMVLFCSPTPTQLTIYQSILGSNTVRSILRGDAGNSLVQIGVLRKLCNSPELLLKDAEGEADTATKTIVGEVTKRFFPPNVVRNEAKHSGKMLCIVDLLKTIRATTDDKVVLVSNFTSTLDIMEAMMRKLRYAFVRLDGKTPQDERMNIVNRFNRDTVSSSFVFLLSAKSGGVGLNLIGANRLILIDSDWNPSTDLQAMARIHRDGQKKVCYIYRLLLAGTMDEKIYQRQLSKLGLSDALMSTEKKTASDTFSQEELRDIFTLHTDSTCLSHRQLDCDCDGQGGGSGAAETVEMTEAPSQSTQDSEDNYPGFVAASQHVVDSKDKNRMDKRKQLVALHKWAHFDCVQHPNAFQDDEVVAEVMKRRFGSLHQSSPSPPFTVKDVVVKKEKETNDGWTSSMLDRLDEPFPSDAESQQDDEDIHSRTASFDMRQTQAGRILFVFAKGFEDGSAAVETPLILSREATP